MALTIKRRRVLVCAYACEPSRGSEPGVGWGAVCGLARYHDLLVVTRTNNRAQIEAESLPPDVNVRFVYFDLSPALQRLKRSPGGVYWYYYLWQRAAARWLVRSVLPVQAVDVAIHSSFATCWLPSLTSSLPVPYVVGPVGGGERVPAALRKHFSWRARIGEFARIAIQNTCIRTPAVRRTLARAKLILASTDETSAWLRRFGIATQVSPPCWFNEDDLAPFIARASRDPGKFVFMSAGKLVPWKGFALGLRAFAAALPQLSGAEYWIAGAGPQQRELAVLAAKLGIGKQIRWLGELPRDDLLRAMARCNVLIHPSMHDSASWVCLEALALGIPVVGLRTGALAHQVNDDCGVLIDVSKGAAAAVTQLTAALVSLANAPLDYPRKSGAARNRFRNVLSADHFIPALAHLLTRAADSERL